MIKEKYLARDWAETMRLYSGLLDQDRRLAFIKQLADLEILLACECRTTSFADDPELDEYLTSKAVEQTAEIATPAQSAKALLALAELDRFEEIANFFKATRQKFATASYFRVISLYLRNGNETHIFQLLKILAVSNIELFSKALDFLLDLNIEGITNSSKGIILLNMIRDSNPLVVQKNICLFEIRSEIKEPTKIFYDLLAQRQIKYAERLTRLTQVVADQEIVNIFKSYIHSGESRESLKLFLDIMQNVTGDYDTSQLQLLLVRSLNPMVKRLALVNRDGSRISKEMAQKFCSENINIGNRSSAEFALELYRDFELDGDIPKEKIVNSLLREPKYQRVALAYKLIKENHLEYKFPYPYICQFLMGYLVYENLVLARNIIKEHYPESIRQDALRHLCCITFRNTKLAKLGKQILFEDLQGVKNGYEQGKEYFGFVSTIYYGHIQIVFSPNHGNLHVPLGKSKAKVNSIVTFRFIKIEEKLEASEIEIVSSVTTGYFSKDFWCSDYFLGQIIKFKPTNFAERSAYMPIPDKRFSFILRIGEIRNGLVKDIRREFENGREFDAKIYKFDMEKRLIFCSKRMLEKPAQPQEPDESDIEDKLALLVSKYKK